jgi:hypothetical protein
MWIRPIFSRRRRHGEYHTLLQELRANDEENHFRYLRMTRQTFGELLRRVGPSLVHERAYRTATADRPELSPGGRLALTLRYLATGNSQTFVSFGFRIARSTACRIIQETCEALRQSLQLEYVKFPSSESDWKRVSQQYSKMWHFPNSVRAIDGEHIILQASRNAGSMYYNYKGARSIVLLAVVDAYYRFIYVDLGDYGRQSDGGILSYCSFGVALQTGSLGLPLPVTTWDTLHCHMCF